MKRLLPSLFIFLFSLPAFSQTEDLGSWMTFGFNKGITKKIGFQLDQEFRIRDNFSTINLFYTNVGLNYKPKKFIKVAAVYRMINKRKEDGSYGLRHRIYGDLTFKVKPTDKWTLSNRVRLQAEWRKTGYAQQYGNMPEVYLRNMFKAGYEIGPHATPYVATELRWQLQNPRFPWGNGFNRQRFIGGMDYKLNDLHTFGAYFLYQKEFNVNDRQTLYIVGLEYTLSID
jgi:hypothetical protein